MTEKPTPPQPFMKTHPIPPTLLKLGLAAILSLPAAIPAQTPPRLLPFQGRLTDADGIALPDGARVVQFKLYNAPVAGQAVWNGEVHKLTVNRGLVSTLLGSKASLAAVDFDREVFLEITVDANGDDQIDLADPPLLPRQSVLPAVFAKESADSRKLDGYDWNDLFAEGATNPPLARISGARLVAQSVTSDQLAMRSIPSDRLEEGAVTGTEIKAGAVDRHHLTAAVLQSVLPAGVIIPFGGSSTNVPPGWLLCDGRPMASRDYPVLAAAIGTGWGNGTVNAEGQPIAEEVRTNLGYDFNLPDLRGAFLRGVGHGSAPNPDSGSRTHSKAGGNAGDAVGSLQMDELKAHNHPVTFARSQTGSDLGEATPLAPHLSSVVGADHSTGFDSGAAFRGVGFGISQVRLGIANTGGNETRPVNVAVHYLIKD